MQNSRGTKCSCPVQAVCRTRSPTPCETDWRAPPVQDDQALGSRPDDCFVNSRHQSGTSVIAPRMHSTDHGQASSGRGRMSFETPTSVRKSDPAQPRVASNVLPNANPDQRLDARPAVDDVSQPRPGVVAGQRLVYLPFLFPALALPFKGVEVRPPTRRGDPVVARGGTVHEVGTGRRRGDPCRRPSRKSRNLVVKAQFRASETATRPQVAPGRDKPVPYNALVGPCTNSTRDEICSLRLRAPAS